MELKDKYAWVVTMGEKGQIVIPKQAREIFNLKPGDTILVLGDKNKGIAIPPQEHMDQLIKNIFGDNQYE